MAPASRTANARIESLSHLVFFFFFCCFPCCQSIFNAHVYRQDRIPGCQNLVFPVAEVLFTFLPKHWPALLPSLAPGDEHELEFAQAEVGRDRPTEERLQASQAELNRLRQVDHPNLFTFSDGSAKEGTRYGVGGVFIQWLDGSETSSAAPASANDSSKATETAAVANALDLIERRLEGPDGFQSICLKFDSRSRLMRPEGPLSKLLDKDTLAAAASSHHRLLSTGHSVRII